jgi:hypothetical protein
VPYLPNQYSLSGAGFLFLFEPVLPLLFAQRVILLSSTTMMRNIRTKVNKPLVAAKGKRCKSTNNNNSPCLVVQLRYGQKGQQGKRENATNKNIRAKGKE